MKKIDNIPGFIKVAAYEKDDIQSAIICSVLGVSDWVSENLIQTGIVDSENFPQPQIRNGEKTGKVFTKYVQISFSGKEIPEEEHKKLEACEVENIDNFYESSNNVITYRFVCPDSLNIESDEQN